MKVGDLLIPKTINSSEVQPMLLIVEIRKHLNNPKCDRIRLQWMPRSGGRSVHGEFSRHIVEKRYKAV